LEFNSYSDIVGLDVVVWAKTKYSSIYYWAVPLEMFNQGFVPVTANPIGVSDRIVFIDKILMNLQKREELKAFLAQLEEEEKAPCLASIFKSPRDEEPREKVVKPIQKPPK
jgi:hypothetical protein